MKLAAHLFNVFYLRSFTLNFIFAAKYPAAFPKQNPLNAALEMSPENFLNDGMRNAE